VPSEVLLLMTDSMTHRGPNERGLHEAPGIALGARRLSIVDVANGHQPAVNEDRSIRAIQNGELYNHAQLRELLAADGHVLGSDCDTEVIPHLYERFGDGFVEHLRGMFGIAVWDAPQRRLVLARDRLGIKPLYYAECGDVLVFGSEIKCILASGLVKTDLDFDAIEAFLTLGLVPGPQTILAGVRKVLPGERLVADAGGVRIERYWEYPAPDSERLSQEEWRERLLGALDASVESHLMSDVPLGAMLSGGLDSSLIVALMARRMSRPVKTFSIGFEGSTNELDDARLVADEFGTEHHEIVLPLDFELDFEALVWHLDEPLADLSSVGFYALSELASKHVTVALSGQGADELLGGYSRHRTAAMIRRWNRLPSPLRGLARSCVRTEKVSRLEELAKLDPVGRFVATRQLLGADGTGPAARAVAAHFDPSSQDPLEAALQLDAKLVLPDDMLHYFDRMSMAHSLEVRVPFLDHELVEMCAAIPDGYKVRRLTTKYLLKAAARGLVPDRIIDKPKIGFFNSAVVDWLKASSTSVIAEYLLDRDAASAEFLDTASIERLVRRVKEGPTSSREAHALLAILMLEVWLSSFLPRATRPVDSVTQERTVGAILK
jgi:asparagine synthase (glutamine-hydrolysing)